LKKIIKIVLRIIVVAAIAAAIARFGFLKPAPPPISAEDLSKIDIIPLPAELTLNNRQFKIEPELGYTFKGISSPRLERAVKRFFSKVSSKTGIAFDEKGTKKIIINCKNKGNKYPSVGDDESYKIKVSKNEISITSNTEIGTLHGLETLNQLIEEKEDKWMIPTIELDDHPRFPWRGLMIDVCRHWIPKEVILRNIDVMASVKMNVLHLHLTDHQAFRIESKKFPKLHEQGSGGKYFKQLEIKEIIDYAANRGIRVYPEFDLPGHSLSWFIGYPELASAPGPYVLDTTFMFTKAVLNPTKETTYEFLDAFYGEMASLFPDKYFHIGGDEVQAEHWDKNDEIQNFMKEKGLKDNHALQAYFNTRLQKILKKYDKKMLGWDEISQSGLPNNEIAIQSWRNQTSLWEAARSGSEGILSTGYYLDHKRPAGFHYKTDPLVITGAVTIDIDSTHWKSYDCKMYVNKDMELASGLYLFGEGENMRGIMNVMENLSDFSNVVQNQNRIEYSHEGPFGTINYNLEFKGDSVVGVAKMALFTIDVKGKRNGGSDMPKGKSLPSFKKIEPLTTKQEKYILGGETCMWTEMVDQTTIESRIWPRAAAVAEKLWSPKLLTSDTEDMYRRLIAFNDHLDEFGSKQKENADKIIQDLAGQKYFELLKTLVYVLHEDVMFNRMQIYKPELFTITPLNRIVDAAPAESYVGYRFNKDVDNWIDNQDEEAKSRIISQLQKWSNNYNELAPAFEQIEKLKEIEPHSKHLSKLSILCLEAIQNPASIENKSKEIDELVQKAAEGYGGTLLSVVDGMRKLLKK